MFYLTGLVGLLLVAAPFALAYTSNVLAFASSLVLGAAIFLASVLEYYAKNKDSREYWLAVVLGIGAVISPFLLNFREETMALWALVATGAAVAVLAIVKLIRWEGGAKAAPW